MPTGTHTTMPDAIRMDNTLTTISTAPFWLLVDHGLFLLCLFQRNGDTADGVADMDGNVHEWRHHFRIPVLWY